MSVKQIDPKACFDLMRDDVATLLIDCRSAIECELTGVVDLSSCGKKPLFVEWTDNQNQRNTKFVDDIKSFAALDTPIIMMCRIGVRSDAACALLAENGFTNLTNMAQGFEGRADDSGHRNSFEGWRAHNLPWVQS